MGIRGIGVSVVVHCVKKVNTEDLFLLELDGRYTICWERHRYMTDVDLGFWKSLDELVVRWVGIYNHAVYQEQQVMAEFIRDWAGEEQWALAVLANL